MIIFNLTLRFMNIQSCMQFMTTQSHYCHKELLFRIGEKAFIEIIITAITT